jgi:hypothetical protein
MVIYRMRQRWTSALDERIRVVLVALLMGAVLYPLLIQWVVDSTVTDCVAHPSDLCEEGNGWLYITVVPFLSLLASGFAGATLLKLFRVRRWLVIAAFSSAVITAGYLVALSNDYPDNLAKDRAVLLVSALLAFLGASAIINHPHVHAALKMVAIAGVAMATLLCTIVTSYAVLYVESASFRAAIDQLPPLTAYAPTYVPKGYAQSDTYGRWGVCYSPKWAEYPWTYVSYGTPDYAPTITIYSVPKTPAFAPPRSCGSEYPYWPPVDSNPCHLIGWTTSGSPVYLSNAVESSVATFPPAFTLVGTTVVVLDESIIDKGHAFGKATILRILSSLRPSNTLKTYNYWRLGNS